MSNDDRKVDRYHYAGTVIDSQEKARAVFIDTYQVNLGTLAKKFNVSAVKLDNDISNKVSQGKKFRGVEALSFKELKQRIDSLDSSYNSSTFKQALEDVKVIDEAIEVGSQVEMVELSPGSYELKTVDGKPLPKAPTPRG